MKIATVALLLLGSVVASPAKRTTSFWYSNVDHTGQYRGYAPDLDGDYTYAVYKAVQPGDGAGIQTAINDDDGNTRHGQWLASQPRVSRVQGCWTETDGRRSSIFHQGSTKSAKRSR